MKNKHSRNQIVDIIRGCAILMVVLGHTISCSGIKNYEDTIIFKMIWSLQMPLFFLISGYCTKFTKELHTLKDFGLYVGRRSFVYLIPWMTWTIIRIMLIQNVGIDNRLLIFKNIFFNMDSMYWFLVVIWIICMIWGIGNYVANKISANKYKLILTLIFSCFVIFIVFVIGLIKGMNFLAIKFVLYYTPYFMIGYIFSKSQELWLKMREIAVFVAMIIYVLLLICFNTYSAEDTLINIFIRIISSLSGCIVFISVICTACSKASNMFIFDKLALAGRESLGVYVVHYLFLGILKSKLSVDLMTMQGLVICAVNYILTLLITGICVYTLSSNKYLKKLIGKK